MNYTNDYKIVNKKIDLSKYRNIYESHDEYNN